MRFGALAPRQRPREAVVPMINVVFLLLIFFLMTAAFVPPAPMDVTLPQGAAAAQAGTEDALYLSADGTLAFRSETGAAALRLAASGANGALDLRADAGVAAADLAKVLSRLAAAGVSEARLITVRP